MGCAFFTCFFMRKNDEVLDDSPLLRHYQLNQLDMISSQISGIQNNSEYDEVNLGDFEYIKKIGQGSASKIYLVQKKNNSNDYFKKNFNFWG